MVKRFIIVHHNLHNVKAYFLIIWFILIKNLFVLIILPNLSTNENLQRAYGEAFKDIIIKKARASLSGYFIFLFRCNRPYCNHAECFYLPFIRIISGIFRSFIVLRRLSLMVMLLYLTLSSRAVVSLRARDKCFDWRNSIWDFRCHSDSIYHQT